MKAKVFTFVLILATLAIWQPKKAFSTILVLKSKTTVFSNTLFAAFLANSKERIAVQNFKEDEETPDYAAMKKIKPSLIVTIGQAPVSEIARIFKRIYTIAVAHYDVKSLGQIKNVIPVPIEVPPAIALPIVKATLPGKKRIGLLYNPKLTKYISGEFQNQVQRNGLELAAIKVDTPEDVYLALQTFKGKIDLFYLVPDATVFKSRAINAILSFTTENNIPYITPSSFFLRENGILSLSVDPVATGMHLYRSAEKILNESKKKRDVIPIKPRVEITYSLENGAKFGLRASKAQNLLKFLVDKGYNVKVVE